MKINGKNLFTRFVRGLGITSIIISIFALIISIQESGMFLGVAIFFLIIAAFMFVIAKNNENRNKERIMNENRYYKENEK